MAHGANTDGESTLRSASVHTWTPFGANSVSGFYPAENLIVPFLDTTVFQYRLIFRSSCAISMLPASRKRQENSAIFSLNDCHGTLNTLSVGTTNSQRNHILIDSSNNVCVLVAFLLLWTEIHTSHRTVQSTATLMIMMMMMITIIRARPKDCFCFRRHPRKQFSISAHFTFHSAL